MDLIRMATRGLPGHPLHPPLTDASIGAYVVATVAVVLGWFGVAEDTMASAGFVALVVALAFALPTAATGFADFLDLPAGGGARRTAWVHLSVMLTATVVFLIAAFLLQPGFVEGRVPGSAALLTVLGFLLLTVGGWIGGSIVYVHGVRVLEDQDATVSDAITPKL